MFDLGKWYTLTMTEGSSRVVSSCWQATKIEWPIVEFRDFDGVARLINVSSPAFVEASLSENQTGKLPLVILPDWSEAGE